MKPFGLSSLSHFALRTATILGFAFCGSSALYGFSLGLRVGPAGRGDGGTNPIGLPPSADQYDFFLVTESGFETSLSALPGLLFGHRWALDNYYIGLGGGLVLDINGTGLGLYSSFGYLSGKGHGWHFIAEYKQAVGWASSHSPHGLIFPYACRIGGFYEF